MKGNDKFINVLNDLLADELTAISQYMVQSEICDGWGFEKLHKAIEHTAKEEMHHAESLIQRILFLEGLPVVSNLKTIKIGKSVIDMLKNDQESEVSAIRAYNQAIHLSQEGKDQSTAVLLTEILKMEEEHADWAEMQRTQIEMMGIQNYLANQTASAGS
ncbi:MAG: bacterioferritin [Bacteroidota bacterium]